MPRHHLQLPQSPHLSPWQVDADLTGSTKQAAKAWPFTAYSHLDTACRSKRWVKDPFQLYVLVAVVTLLQCDLPWQSLVEVAVAMAKGQPRPWNAGLLYTLCALCFCAAVWCQTDLWVTAAHIVILQPWHQKPIVRGDLLRPYLERLTDEAPSSG